jgi:uncharacterized membrane protein
MTSLTKPRIETIDLLKGIVMVIMALDHVRDYFHVSSTLFDPADPTQSSLALFFTRWITHFCAPTFSFLAGLSAFMVGKRKSPNELSVFLVKRGLWLIFIELTIVNFGWYFDVLFRANDLLVIWSLGASMIVLAAIIHLPRNFILAICCVAIFGHNLLDAVHFQGSILWSMFHDIGIFRFVNDYTLYVEYPVVPWFATMALGYYFGSFYDSSVDVSSRRKIFNIIGGSALAGFVILRFINLYGDPNPFHHYDSLSKDLISFLNPTKYPPSLMYLLMTLGGGLLFLANTEKWKGTVVNFFSTFGRVPFFYYILHIYLIHLLALFAAEFTGIGWRKMILMNWISIEPELRGYGFNLGVVYLVWIGVILSLYPLCKRFDAYKKNNKEKWWLSYL